MPSPLFLYKIQLNAAARNIHLYKKKNAKNFRSCLFVNIFLSDQVFFKLIEKKVFESLFFGL